MTDQIISVLAFLGAILSAWAVGVRIGRRQAQYKVGDGR